MAPQPPVLLADLAALAGAIERWAADLALAEEPARFVGALAAAAPTSAARTPPAGQEPGGGTTPP